MRAAGISIMAAAVLFLAALPLGPRPMAQERKSVPPRDKDNPLTELISGYYFTPLKLRALQDDDFDNPGFTWVTQGEKLWSQVEGGAQKSCASCHQAAPQTMRGIGAGYPRFQEAAKAVVNLEQRVNICRQDKMKATPWPYGSDAMLAMTAYLRLQSRGLPIDVQSDGNAKEAFEIGKSLYNARAGQFNMSCTHCHNDHYGDNLRAELLSQGHSNGYPAFQAKSQRFISLHERIRGCYTEMRAQPYDLGSPELVALELYLAWRGKGLPVETPAVRR
jgi:sulfur-oxidizing protein SoxA